MKLEQNVGARDAQVRTIAGAVVIVVALFFVENPWVRLVLALVAAVLAATGYLHSCYLYKLLGKNTAHKEQGVSTTPTEASVEAVPTTVNLEPASKADTAEKESDKVS